MRVKANGFVNIPGNEENLEWLITNKESLVPFLGAGFSVPVCPTWAEFLEVFFQKLKKDDFLLPDEEKEFCQMKQNLQDKGFEKIADFLVEKSGKRKFREVLKRQFHQKPLTIMIKKFEYLHQAFPNLKITTNFDCLIESSSPVPYVKVCYGNQPVELQRMFTYIKQNALLKIHGGFENPSSIVLSSSQYAKMYGHATGFDPKAALPFFLTRVFANSSVLFIGCSLVRDRIIMIMENLEHMRPHFAIMRWPEDREERVLLKRSLSEAGITPIWITNFQQIEKILQQLSQTLTPHPTEIDHGITFVGREKELRQIKENLKQDNLTGKGNVQMITGRLYSIEGAGGVGKTTLAIEAAKQFSIVFKDGVLEPIRVDEHTPKSFVMHLASQFNIKVTEPADAKTARQLVTAILKDRIALLILDNAVKWKDLKYILPTETHCTILVTTRNREIYDRLRLRFRKLQVHEISLETFTEKESLELFQQMLGNKYCEEEKDIYLEIAANLGFLPLALRQAISLMLFGPRYGADRLLDKLASEDRLKLLRKGQAVEESDCLTIESVFDLSSPLLDKELTKVLEYLAVCSPGPIPLFFLQQMAPAENIEERLEHLYTLSWCERREIHNRQAYELHQLVRDLVQKRFGNRFRDVYIQLIHDIFLDRSVHFGVKEVLILQLEEVFHLLKESRDKRLIDWINDLYSFCAYRGFTDFYLRLSQCLEELFPNDSWTLRVVYRYRALILRRQGKLEEAMALHKKEETICEELGYRTGLARSYGNQALILSDWGKLEEAMKLHKEEETICSQEKDRAGLAACYGNQALIFKARGELEEAMKLHKKEETIYDQLSDQEGIARSYGNQALILKAWGKLNDAMKLHKKEETICNQLGNRAGLAACYGNQALILKAWGKLDEAMALHKNDETICIQLDNRAGLAACYGNQALILKEWGKLDEAMALHKKEETIYKQLGNRSRVARSYGSQALILSDWGKLAEAMELHKKEEVICNQLDNRAGLARSYGHQALIIKTWGKLKEAMEFLKKEEIILEQMGDRAGLAVCYGNQALILKEWGKLDEAMTLHKKEEAIYKKLGNRAGLALSYGNQALIHSDWGKLDNAMALHKEEETICMQLSNRSGLARSYGNQALILSNWGKLDEAMKLHKEEEKICNQLGNRTGLAACYGNQALILKTWGNLEEAMKLHKKEEAICIQLNNRSGLARSYGNQALILSDWKKLDKAMILHKKEEKIAEELGDCSQLARSYGNQALILKEWGKLDEAMALHKKEEKIAEELGDRSQLARSYGNQALILKEYGKLDKAMALHKKEEKIAEELGDRSQLARSYGKQALIHITWGELDEAMALYKKEEQICVQLGDRAGLALNYSNQALILIECEKLEAAMILRKKEEIILDQLDDRTGLAICYGNQALILSEWGKLKEAMTIHKKEEAIYDEFEDHAGLAITWWNQGNIYNKKKNYKKQVELWQKSIDMNKALGISTDEDENKLQELLKKIKHYP